ncbi:MAG TPA: VanZ family protein [Phycisphaerae bacterium]|nr:VanZ family protein [Phycisphaerae bacterium]HNU46051.1 VanZ family protein [Phycisphaerae bacterium]
MTRRRRAKEAKTHFGAVPAPGGGRWRWIYSTRVHLVLYSFLLVATPFLMLRRFLQEAIGKLSVLSVDAFGVRVPIIPVVGAVVVTVGLVLLRRQITWGRVIVAGVVLLMNFAAQQVNDYYFDHNFYDLQQNWHYMAYAVFAYMMYRDLAPRGYPLHRIMLITFVVAASFSTFDESFQLKMSGRAFEMGDVAKDVYGCLMGMLVVYSGPNRAGVLWRVGRKLRHEKLRDYFRDPRSLVLLMFVVAFLVLLFSSLLSNIAYAGLVLVLGLSGSAVLFVLLHVTRYAAVRYALLALLVVAGGVQGWSLWKYRDDPNVYARPGLIFYRGVAVPFFDVLIFPDGSWRPVDKKATFMARDRQFFLKREPDIVLVGSGSAGQGGRGFPEPGVSQFLYNPYTRRGTQVIILPNAAAFREYRRLREEGKSVLFVIHNA